MNAQALGHIPDHEQCILDAEHPWPGLAAFQERDAKFFFGRDGDIEALHRLVRRERLTVLFGVSGLGKSSLLQAGLFPRLRQENVLPIRIRLDFSDSAASLLDQIKQAIQQNAQVAAIETPNFTDGETLWEFFHRKDGDFWDARNRVTIPLLCFDQFEEIFTLGREGERRNAEIRQLVIELADLIEGRCPIAVKERLDESPDEAQAFAFNRHPYKLIVSLREDFLADLEGLRNRMPSVILNRFRLRHMNGQQALEVTDQTKGRLIEHSVAEAIVCFVAGAKEADSVDLETLRVEPALLSLVCQELNEKRIRQKTPRIDAALLEGSRAEILEDFYERSLQDHAPELRRFIEDKLITTMGYRDSVAYESALETPGITAGALSDLVDRRLLRVEDRGGVRRVELTHDVLTEVVKKSRDQRRLREQQEQAETAKHEAEVREAQVRRQLRRSRRTAVLLGFLFLAAVGAAVWAYISQKIAVEAKHQAQRALVHAEQAKQLAQRALVEEAAGKLALQHSSESLPLLAHATRIGPAYLAGQGVLLDALLRRSWSLPITHLHHDKVVNSAQFSPDGTRVVTASNDNTARVWDAHTGKALTEPLRHQNGVTSARFSPNGTRVVTASKDAARVWDARSGKPLGEPMKHEKGINSAEFSPDGTRVVTASFDHTARVWDAQNGKPLTRPLRHDEGPNFHTEYKFPSMKPVSAPSASNYVNSAQFSSDGTRVVTATYFTWRVWDVVTGKTLTKPLRHDIKVELAKFSPDGTRVVTTSSHGHPQIWNALTGEALTKPLRFEEGDKLAEYSPDGTRLVTASYDSARVWDARTGEPLTESLHHESDVTSIQFSPDGTRVVTVSKNNALRVWDAKTGQALTEPLHHEGRVNSVQFSPDGARLLTASDDKTVRVWDARVGQALAEPLNDEVSVSSAQFSPDGAQVLTISTENDVRIWDARTGKPLTQPLHHQKPVDAAQFSSDGACVVTASEDHTARVWDAHTGKGLTEPLRQDELTSARFSPKSCSVVTASEDNSARVWDGKTGQVVGEPMRHQSKVTSARFSSDGTRVVTASEDHTARVWDAKTGKAISEPMRHKNEVTSARFSPDGTRVVTASKDGTARLWDARTGQALTEPMRHEKEVFLSQFSEDGTRVLTASEDQSARVWDAKTGQAISEPIRHNGGFFAMFSPDSTRVLTGPSPSLRKLSVEKDKIRMWDAQNGKALYDLIPHDSLETLWDAQFSRDSSRVVTAFSDGVVQVWDTQTGRALTEPMRDYSTVTSAEFSPDGTRLLTTSASYTARLWDVFIVSPSDAEMVAELAEAVAGYRVSDQGMVVPVPDAVDRLAQLREDTKDATVADSLGRRFVRWFLADRWTRTISPLSSVTVCEYIQRRIDEGRREEAERDFPGHPLLRGAPCPVQQNPPETSANP